MTTELTEDLDFRELDQFVSECGGVTDDFSETVKHLISDGLGTEMMRKIGTGLFDQLTAEIVQNKKLLLEIILLTFGFSVLKNFAGSFQGLYVSKICFIFMYCVLVVLLLQSFFTLQEVVQMVGSDSLPDEQKITLEVAKMIREIFLQQNAYDPVDCYSPLERQHVMLSLIKKYSDLADKALAAGVQVDKIAYLPVRSKFNQAKYEQDIDALLKQVGEDMEKQFAELGA